MIRMFSLVLALGLLVAQVSPLPLTGQTLLLTSPEQTLIGSITLDPDVPSTPLSPSQDPWYRAPPNWTTAHPGAVLRVRAAPHLRFTLGNVLAAYQLLFRTSDSHRNATWAVTTLLLPGRHYRCAAGDPARCAHALLSYQTPYDSAAVDASPSFALRGGEPGGGYGEIAEALWRGWAVSVPDYEGPGAAYTAGVLSGLVTLDSVRAVLAVGGNFGLRSGDAKVAMWGYSGGALASEFAAELAPTYAPELQFAGTALGGLPPVVSSVFDQIDGTAAAGLYASGLLGMTSQHASARAWLLGRLRPAGARNASEFLMAGRLGGAECVARFRYQAVTDYFVGGRADVHAPVMEDMFAADGVMGAHGTPQMPMFVYKAVGDELSLVGETDDLVKRLCAQGANILYHRNLAGGHQTEWVNGRPAAVAFLSSVLEEEYEMLYEPVGCTVRNVTVDLVPKQVGEAVVELGGGGKPP